ncbi:hypothetical protein NHX12_025214 [Muraenolepis orangiensis]|uniref:Actin binding LIM protein 1b n=1 Tax=Muraenolepis orangiensis TaxID=630683 RepID=A0A9Q0EIW7_9TELE|nr:hypothetical protein NHX12_025214 [Muraenolepis orangiensis]
MPALPGLSSLGRICSSGGADDTLVLDRVKRKNSVRRMSIIEDGEVAEVLYLIPKASMMAQLPFLNPDDYVLCEKVEGMPFEMPPERRRVQCFRCGEACKGEVLRVHSRHFHLNCFTCKVCGCDLARGGFFLRSGDYLCTQDYQQLYGTRCQGCGEYVEGEVVTALGKAYHPACFVCTCCRRPFPTGDRVTFNRKECLCQRCSAKPRPSSPNNTNSFSDSCVGCGRTITNGQALLALQGRWHLGCFKCSTCHHLLTGEYITRDGLPYCVRDYQVQFGVQCDACNQFITGKVLEDSFAGFLWEMAGDRHFHPSCAQCCRCNLLFREGEDMFLQGSVMWHPACRGDSRGDDCNRRSITPSLQYFYRPSELQATRTSTENISSRPGSTLPASPGHSIYVTSLFSSPFSDHFLPLTAGNQLSRDLRPGFSHLDRGLSLPNLLEHTVYPYEVLAVTSRGRGNLPRNVDRTRLERYLSPDSFYKVFEMNFQDFNQLPLWKRNDLKKIVHLF